jgi:Uma2 family endonuclease
MTSQAVATPQPGTATLPDEDMPPEFSLDINSILALLADDDALDDWLLRFNADNEDSGYQFEIDRRGRLLAMASEGRDGSERQFNLQFDLQIWTSTGPGGKVVIGNELVRMLRPGRRAADAGWIAPEQVAELPPAGQRFGSIPFAPRFVVEIRSRSNTLESQQSKMAEWIAYGVALGWLIDPFLRQVHIYRPNTAPEVLDDPETVSGDPELPGFVFNVRSRVFDLQ